jgi:hypothetical protein
VNAASRFAAGLALGVSALTGHAESWPEVRSPADAQVESIASDMIFNGRPARLFRFQTTGSEQDLLAFYREQFGAKKVVENRLKKDAVIATRQGDYFLTVQLHALNAKAMQGTVMVTNIAGKPLVSEVSTDTKRVLPPDSRVVSTMQSDDAGKRSLMLMAMNQNSTGANRDHVVQAMQQRGFRIVREDSPPDARDASVMLVMNSATEEAQVTISDAGMYRSVLINRVKETR